MADVDEPSQKANLDDLWSQFDPETQQTVINLFIHVCYQFLASRAAAAAGPDERASKVESESLN